MITAIKFIIEKGHGTNKFEIDLIEEYNLRRNYTHIPLTNVWVNFDSNPIKGYIIFPRLRVGNPEDNNILYNKLNDITTIMYADRQKLKKLQNKDEGYIFKE